ncbi:MAG: sigma-70 family RNA polymerase sigma factor [Planctomycetota bacterium]
MFEENLPGSIQSYVRRVAHSVARGDDHLADELEQATFLVALQNGPRKQEALRPWLYSVCANTLRGILKRDRTDADAPPVEPVAAEAEPLQIVLDHELRLVVRRALRRIPPSQGEALELRFLEELSAEEVARRLDVPIETARSRIKRGLTSLRSELERYRGEQQRRAAWLVLPGGFALQRRSIAAAFLGTVAVLLGVLALGRAREAKTVDVETAASTGRTSVVDLSVTKSGGARRPIHSSATVHLLPGETLGRYWPQGSVVELVQDGASRAVFALVPGETLTITDLPTGATSARVNGIVVDERTLVQGEQDWELAWGDASRVDLLVLHEDGEPAADVELFESDALGRAPRRVGRTGDDGRASVEVTSLDSWLAARGAPGAVSRAFPVEQSIVQSDGTLTLRLRERPVQWFTIEGNAGDDLSGAYFGWMLRIEDVVCRFDESRGVSSAATWIPPWRDVSGRLGFPAPRMEWSVALRDAEGELLWVGPRFRRGDAVPDALAVAPLQRFQGRLVDEHGAVLAGVELGLGKHEWPGELGSVTTDSEGRFDVSARILPEEAVLKLFHRPVAHLAEPDSAGQLGDIVPIDGGLVSIDLSVVGATGPVSIRPFSSAYARIGQAHHLAHAVRRAPELRLEPGASARVWAPKRTIAGVVVVGRVDDQRVVRMVRHPFRSGTPESLVVDLRAEPSVTVQGSIDPALLPVTGLARELTVGHTEALPIDPVTGRFSLTGLPAGTWTVELIDREGRLHSCSAPRTVEAGTVHDIGRLDVARGRLQVVLPDVSLESRLRVVVTWNSRQILSRRVTDGELDRGWIDLDLPAGSHRIALIEPMREHWLAEADVSLGVGSQCHPTTELVAVLVKEVHRSIEDVSRTRLDVFDDDGRLVATVEGDALAAGYRGRVCVVCRRSERFHVVQTDGVRSRSADVIGADRGVTAQALLPWRWGFHRNPDRSVSAR